MARRDRLQTLGYSLLGKQRLTRDLGIAFWTDLIEYLWPVLDASVAAALYRGKAPLAVSAFLADKLHVPRCGPGIERLPPAQELVEQAHNWFEPGQFRPRISTFGGTTVVSLAETDIVVTAPLADSEFDTLFRSSKWDMFAWSIAGGEVRTSWDTSLLPISDSGKVTEVAWEVSKTLGYKPTDHSWVPKAWTEQPAQPNFPILYEQVSTADGTPVTLRSIVARTNAHDIHFVRPWSGPQTLRRLPILLAPDL